MYLAVGEDVGAGEMLDRGSGLGDHLLLSRAEPRVLQRRSEQRVQLVVVRLVRARSTPMNEARHGP